MSQVAAGATSAVGAPASGFALGGAADAGATAATYAGAAVAGAVGAAAVLKGARAIIAAFRRFLRRRAAADIVLFTTTVREAVDGGQLTEDDLGRLRAQEQEYEAAFQAKALARWEKMVPRLLEVGSPDERALALRQFQDREQRILTMRHQAMTERAHGAIERTVLRALSPSGAYWKLNPYVKEHTLDCLVMGEKFWPWEVLDKYHPPRHHGCPCTLFGLQEALARGLMTLSDIPDTAEAVRRATSQMTEAMRMMESFERDPALVAAVERLEEAGVLSVDLRGIAAPAPTVGEVDEFIAPGGLLVETGGRVTWRSGEDLCEGEVVEVVVHDDEQLGRYGTFHALDDDGRVHLHVLASHVEEAPAFSARLHPRDRLGRWRDTPTLNHTKPAEVAPRIAATSLAWMQHGGNDLSGAPPDAEVEANWAKQVRGRVSTDKQARSLVADAIAENEANPLWQRIVASHLPDHVLVSKGERKDGRFTLIDTEHGAHRVAGTTVIPDVNVHVVTGEGIKSPPERAAASSGYGLAALLRHEYGHSVDDTLRARNPEARRAIIDAIPDVNDLSYYAEFHKSKGNDGEVIPELLALVTHPDYREEDFPTLAEAGRMLIDAATTGWVIQEAGFDEGLHPRNRLGKWIDTPDVTPIVALAARSVDYTGAWDSNPKRRDAVQRTIGELLARFPIPFKGIHVREAEEFNQLAGKSKDTIYVSPRFMDDEFMDKHFKTWSGVSTQTKPEHVIVHEFGHVLDGWLLANGPDEYRATISAYVQEPVTYKVGGKDVTAPRWQAGDADVVSAYAGESQFEFFAEAFTDWYLNGDKAKKRSRELGKLIEGLMGDHTSRLQEAPDFDLLHPRNRMGRFRLVPRTSEEVLALRARAYEKRWGPVPPGGLAQAPTPVDDPELLDALEAAQAKNVEHLGPDVIDHFGEMPVVLVEDLGTGFWGAVAQADGLYSAHALRNRFVYNGVEQPSFLDGKAKPHRGDKSQGKSGTGGAHDLASVIRHEWWHYVERQLSYDQMREYRSLFPRVESGGIDGERIAWEVGSNAGADQGETAAEVFSLVSDPDFKPGEWPDWVYESGQAMLNLIYEIQEGLR